VSGPDRDRFYYPLQIMTALAEMAKLYNSNYKVKLLNAVAKEVPLVDATLDKIAQALREMKTE
jgi:hypothetical protein